MASVDVIMRSVAVGMILLMTWPLASVDRMVRGPGEEREEGAPEDSEDSEDPRELSTASEFGVDAVVGFVITRVPEGEGTTAFVRSDAVGSGGWTSSGSGVGWGMGCVGAGG